MAALRALLAVAVVLACDAARAQTATNDVPATAEVPAIPLQLPDVSVYEGKPVAAVRARIDGLIWTKLPALAAPKVGEPFRTEIARAELMRLLSIGGFASGVLEVKPDGDGVAVIYRLVPARLVRRVVLKGNVLGDDEVLRAGGLGDVREVTEKGLDAAAKKVRDYYVHRGFPKARIEIATIETDDPLVVVVQVLVEPGASLVVSERVFAGLPTWDAGALAAARAYGVEVGARADEDALDVADRALANALRAGGFPGATVSHAHAPARDGGVVLTIDVVAGPKVLPSFEGNLIFDREQLLDVLDLEGEADRSPVRLASKIESAYRRRGYFDVRVEVEMQGKPEDERRTLSFRIHEGRVVTVAKRTYPCLEGALSKERIDAEIDSFLEEDLSGEGFGDASHAPIDQTLGPGGDVAKGARLSPDLPPARKIYAPETYERAVEHLKELFRAEGYMFVEVGDPGVVRAGCAKGTMPGVCKAVPPPPLTESKLCVYDANRLPLPVPQVEKKHACVPDPSKGLECSDELTVVVPINPGPRSYLWDVSFDGTHAVAPASLMKVVASTLRLGEPLSLRDAEAARQAIATWYRDEGFVYSSVKVAFEYSPDKSRARMRFLITEGEQVVIDRIYVEGSKRTLESLIRDRLLIKEGGVFRGSAVRESQDRLVKLGVFQSVSIGLVNPNIPAKRKSVVVNVVERPTQHIDYRVGYSTGEGFRFFGEYGYANFFGYAVALDLRIRFSYQPFLGATCTDDGTNCTSTLYDPVVIRRFRSLEGLDRLPRRLSAAVTLPHTPIFGSPVRTTLELVNVLDLRRDFKLERYSPILTFTYQPLQWLTAIFSGDVEYNRFRIFDDQTLARVLQSNPALQTLLRVPAGDTGVVATNATVTMDWRDNRLGATKNGYVSLSTEYVRSILRAENGPRQDFVHLTTGGGYYKRIDFLPKKPVLAVELKMGGNFNVFSCSGVGDTSVCDTYPDRLFYIGGIETNRGFFAGQMLPQDSIDELSADPGANLSSLPCDAFPVDPVTGQPANVDVLGAVGATGGSCGTNLAAIAPRGGNVFINPRVELRVPAFKWGGFVFFVDASNTWRKRSNFRPWILRYSVGPGLSIDTPVGPVALDFGFNLSRYANFGEPPVVFSFSIGRF